MRLGQLARKLDIETNDIVKYLKKQDIIIDNHLNTKLEDEQIELITTHFHKPEVKEEVVVETPEIQPAIAEVEIQEEETSTETEIPVQITEIATEEEVTIETPEVVAEEEKKEEEPQQTVIEAPSASGVLTVMDLLEKAAAESEAQPLVEFSKEDKIPEDIEATVIRAPKVELQGFKVLGKIELPENPKNKKKEEAKAEETPSKEAEESTLETQEPAAVIEKPTVHPNKRTKILNVEKEYIDDSLFVEEVVEKPKKAKELKQAKKQAKKKKAIVKEATPEELAKAKLREKRKRQRKNTKEAAKKQEKHWLKRLWDAIK